MNHLPNILIVRGSSRNVGKTWIACALIRKLVDNHHPVGVKITPHFHELDSHKNIILKKEGLVITEELNISGKDSSLMLQAGAQKVYYIQAKNEMLPKVAEFIRNSVNRETPLVAESGGLYYNLEPGILININGIDTNKEFFIRKSTNVINLHAGEEKDHIAGMINFENGRFTINA